MKAYIFFQGRIPQFSLPYCSISYAIFAAIIRHSGVCA